MKYPYEYIFDLLDFADEMMPRIIPGGLDNNSYFMTLVYIEDILDKYGRGFVSRTAQEVGRSNEDARALQSEATRRMEVLRSSISTLTKEFDFNQVLDAKAEQFKREWRKR